ncbi:MAG: hypothetical protein J6I49_06445 [Bacteroidales bacterium]|nr:hypothetical protein [Bacteroidales bacterium]
MGTQRGKLGTAVGSIYRRRQVYRAYNPNVRNPQTLQQQTNRAKFSALSQVCRALSPVTSVGLRFQADRQNLHYRNVFMSLNYPAVQATTPEDVQVGYAALQVAAGGAVPVLFGTARFDTPGTVSATFAPQLEVGGANGDDRVYLAVFNPTNGTAVVGKPVLRGSGTVSVAVPATWTGESVHVYGFACTPERETWNEATRSWMMPDMPSPSSYLGEGELG